MPFSGDRYVPLQSWDELTQRSVRRGAHLLRRRRLIAATPVGVALLAGVGLAGSIGAGPTDERLVVVPASADPEASAGPSAAASATWRPDSDPGPAGHAGGPPGAEAGAGAQAPEPEPSEPGSRPAPHRSSQTLTFSDPSGDAQPAYPGSRKSQAPRDISAVRADLDPAGVLLTVRFVGATSSDGHHYYALLEDPRTKCVMRIWLSTDQWALQCGGQPAERARPLRRTAPDDARSLSAYVHFAELPREVSRANALRVAAETYDYAGPPPPPSPPFGPAPPWYSPVLIDEARSPWTLPKRTP